MKFLNFFFLFFLQPDREDEYARIEKAGGKIMQWQGPRVSGVLAMSRSIGRSKLQIFFNPVQ